MLSLEKLNHYYPKLATRILGHMRKCYLENRPVTIDDLKKRFVKSSSIISQNLKILIEDKLINRIFIGNPHFNGPRVRLVITKEGLLMANNYLFEWLSDTEQKAIKTLSLNFKK